MPSHPAFMLTVFAIAGGTALMLTGLGCWLQPWCPRTIKPFFWPLAPALGLAIASGTLHWASQFGLGSDRLAWPLVLVGALGLVREIRRGRAASLNHPSSWLGALAFLLLILPLLRLGYLTYLGGTIDGISYAVRSEYLRQHGFGLLPEVPSGQPWVGWVRPHLHLLRAGDVLVVGALARVFGLRSFQLLTIFPVVVGAMVAPLAYAVARTLVRLRPTSALLSAVAVVLSPILAWPAYDNFLSQTTALPLTVALLLVAARARMASPGSATFFAVLFTGLLSIYPVYAAYAGLSSALLIGYRCVFEGAPAWRALLRWSAVATGVAIATNGPALLRAPQELAYVARVAGPEGAAKGVGQGNITHFVSPASVLGLENHRYPATNRPLPTIGVLIASPLLLFGLAADRGRRRTRLALIVASFAIYAGHQRFFADPPHGYPYGYFKCATLIAPWVLAGVFAGLADVWNLGNRWWPSPRTREGARQRTIMAALIRRPTPPWRTTGWPRLAWRAVVVVAGGTLLFGEASVMADHQRLFSPIRPGTDHLLIDAALIEAATAARDLSAADEWISIDIPTGPRQNWLGYLLHDRRIRFDRPRSHGPIITPGETAASPRLRVFEAAAGSPPGPTLGDEMLLWQGRRYAISRRSR